MVVVDTNVLTYLLIEGDRTRDAQALFALDADWKSEAFVLIEFRNILATYLRANALTRNQAHALVSAYDARFLSAAQTFKLRLVTDDVRLRQAAPALTISLSDALAA